MIDCNNYHLIKNFYRNKKMKKKANKININKFYQINKNLKNHNNYKIIE